jgi:hypothetical protein
MPTNDPYAENIELSVYSYSDPTKRLDVLPLATSPKFLEEVTGVGAGSFSTFAADPKLVRNPSLLDYRNVIKLSCGGVVKSAMVLQGKAEVLIDTGEQSAKGVSLTGEGLKTWFRGAVVYPDGNSIRATSPQDRVFSWASPRGSWYNSAFWKAPVKIEQYHMTAATGRIWNYLPADWPDAPSAWWVWSQAPTNKTSANKQGSVPPGDVYFRYEFTTPTADAGANYSIFSAADDTYAVFMDSALVIDGTAVGTHSHETDRYDFTLDPGPHVLAVRARNLTNPTGTGGRGPAGLLLAMFKAGDPNAGTAASLITATGGSGWTCQAYPTQEPGWSVGEIMLQLLSEAKSRGVLFPNWITPTFTDLQDSNGLPWANILPFSFSVGSTYADVIDQMEELAVETWINPDTLEFSIYQTRGLDKSVQTRKSSPVILREGYNLTQAGNSGAADLTNKLMMKTADGWVIVAAPDATSSGKYGVLEGELDTGVGSTVSQQLAAKVFGQHALPEQGATYTLISRPGARPFVDINVGDWVQAQTTGGAMVRRRVMSISIQEQNNGQASYAIEFDSIFQTKQQEYDRLSALASGSGLGAGYVTATGSGVAGTSPTIGTGISTTVGTPAAPQNVNATSVGSFTLNGRPAATMTVNWDLVTQNTDGSDLIGIDHYEIWGNPVVSMQGAQMLASVSGAYGTAVIDSLVADTDYQIMIRAYVSASRYSAYSTALAVHTAKPNTKMGVPTTPTVSSSLGVVSAAWDGTLGTGNPPVQFVQTYAEISTTQTGTYTVAGSSLLGAGQISILNQTVGSTLWLRLRAIDTAGTITDPSTAVSVVVTGVDASDLGQQFEDQIQAISDQAAAAQTAAGNAQSAADAATAAAASAANAGGVIYQQSAPTGANAKTGFLWIRVSDHKPFVYDPSSSTWIPVTDQGVIDAANAAANALNAANSATATANLAAQQAGQAQTTANGKNTVWYLSTAPTGSHTTGDTWFDTANDNRISKWDGTQWVLLAIGAGALGANIIGPAQLAAAVNTQIAKGVTDAATAQAAANTAATAAGTAQSTATAAAASAASAAFGTFAKNADTTRPSQWLRAVYKNQTAGYQYIPTYTDILGVAPTSTDYLTDAALSGSTAWNLGDHYFALLRGVVSVTFAITLAFTFSSDDTIRIYIDGVDVFSHAGSGAQPAFSTALAAGTHTVDFLLNEYNGSDYINAVTPSISSQVTTLYPPLSLVLGDMVGQQALSSASAAANAAVAAQTTASNAGSAATAANTAASNASTAAAAASTAAAAAQTTANTATTNAAAANTAAANANTAALTAAGIANGKGTVYFQPAAPSPVDGTGLWIDSDDGNKPYKGVNFGTSARTNLFSNPTPPAGGTTTNWGSTAGTSGVTTIGITGDGSEPAGAHSFVRTRWTTATTDVSGGVFQHSVAANVTLTAGTTYTFSGYIRASMNQRLVANIEWYDSTNTRISATVTATPFDQKSSFSWTRVSATSVAPTNASYATCTIYSSAGGSGVVWNSGAFLDATAFLLEAASTPGIYFDGSFPGSNCTWTGTAFASTSLYSGPAWIATQDQGIVSAATAAAAAQTTATNAGTAAANAATAAATAQTAANNAGTAAATAQSAANAAQTTGNNAAAAAVAAQTTATNAGTAAANAASAASTANTAAATAQTAANTANTAASTANQNALSAAGIAAGKGTVYLQPGAPSPVDGNGLWIDSDDGNKPYKGVNLGASARVNLVPNPSLEVATTSWTAKGSSVTIARSTAQAFIGSASLAITTAGANLDGAQISTPNTGGTGPLSASAMVLAPAGFTFRFRYSNNVDTSPATNYTGTGSWQAVTITLPKGSNAPTLLIEAVNAQSATTLYVDAVIAEVGSTVGSYFDGSMAGVTWAGTANASASNYSGPAWIATQDQGIVTAASAAAAAQTTANNAASAAAAAQTTATNAGTAAANAASAASSAQTTATNAGTAAAAAQTTANNAGTAAATAQTAANNAASAATTAQTAATNANTAALNAAGIANSKGQVIYQISAPTGSNASAANLWIRTTDNVPFSYAPVTNPDLTAVTVILTPANAQTETTVMQASVVPNVATPVAITLTASMYSPNTAKAAIARLRDGATGTVLASFNFTDKGDSTAGTAQTWTYSGTVTPTSSILVVTIESSNTGNPTIYATHATITATNWQQITDSTATNAATAAAAANTAASAAQTTATNAGSAAAAAQTTATNAATSAAAAATAAANAQTAAVNAQGTASTALTTANGKNTVIYSTTTPTANYQGAQNDVWFQYSGQSLIGQWQFTSNGWVSKVIDNVMIANLDAGKITTGLLSADRIGANSITASKIAIADFTDKATDPYFSNSESISSLPSSSLVASTASGVPTGAPYPTVAALGSFSDGFIGPWFPVQPGEQYYVEYWAASSGATGALGVGLWVANTPVYGGNSFAYYTVSTTTTTWTKLSGTITVPALGALGTTPVPPAFARIRVGTSNSSGWYLTGVHVRRMNGGELIVDGSITTNELGAQSVTADKVKVGTLTAAQIQANSLTSQVMAVGDFGNRVDDPDLAQGGLGWTLGGTVASVTDGPGGTSTNVLVIAAGSTTRDSTTAPFNVSAGDSWYAEMWIRATTVSTVAGTIQIGTTLRNGQTVTDYGSFVSVVSNTITTAWQKLSGTIVIPSGRTSLQFRPSVRNDVTNGAFQMTGFRLRRLNGGELIVDGSITTNELGAQAVTADKVKVGSLTAVQIQAGSLLAQSLAIGDFTNLVDDPDFIAGGWIHRSGPTTATTLVTTTGLPGASWKLDGVSTEVSVATSGYFNVDPGQPYALSVRAQNQLTSTATGSSATLGRLRIQWQDQTGVNISVDDLAVTADGIWATYTATLTAPATARRGVPMFIHAGTATGGSWWAGMPRVRRQYGGDLIVDGSISANDLSANSITAAKISAGAVTSPAIAAGAVTADKLVVGDPTNLVLINETTGVNLTASLPGNIYGSATTISGGYLQRVTNTNGFFMFTYQHGPIPFEPGEQLLFQFNAVSDVAVSVTPSVWAYNPSTGSLSSTGASQAVTTTEQTFAVNVTAPAFDRGSFTTFILGLVTPTTATNLRLRSIRVIRLVNSTLIQDGSIATNELAANAVTAAKMQVGTITAQSGILAAASITTATISDAAITDAKIANIDAAKITTGFLDAGRIQSTSITSRMLAVGDFKDYIDGSNFEDPTKIPWSFPDGTTSTIDTTVVHNGNNSVRFNTTGPYNDPTPTVATTTTVNYNLSPNPAVQSNTTGWSVLNSGTMSRVASSGSYHGLPYCMKFVFGEGTHSSYRLRHIVPITGGQVFSASAGVRADGNNNIQILVSFNDSTGSEEASQTRYTSAGTTVTNSTTWQQMNVRNMTAPSAATAMVLDFYGTQATTATQAMYITGVMVNPNFTQGSPTYFDGNTADTTSSSGDMSQPGDYNSSVNYSWNGTANNSATTQTIVRNTAQPVTVVPQPTVTYSSTFDVPVQPGQSLVFAGWVYATTGYNGTDVGAFFEAWDPHNGGAVYGRATLDADSFTAGVWTKVSATVSIPTGAQTIRGWFSVNHTRGLLYIDDFSMKAAAGVLIEDGGITAGKLSSASVSADNIQAGAITATAIDAQAIDGMTITGAHIQTSSDGARTELTDQGLRVVDENNSELVKLGYSIPTGMSVKNPRTGLLVPLASHVFGVQVTGSSGTGTITIPSSGSSAALRLLPSSATVSSASGRTFCIASVGFDQGPGDYSVITLKHYNTTSSQTTTDAVTFGSNTLYTDSGGNRGSLMIMGVSSWTPGASRTIGVEVVGSGVAGHKNQYTMQPTVVFQA